MAMFSGCVLERSEWQAFDNALGARPRQGFIRYMELRRFLTTVCGEINNPSLLMHVSVVSQSQLCCVQQRWPNDQIIGAEERLQILLHTCDICSYCSEAIQAATCVRILTQHWNSWSIREHCEQQKRRVEERGAGSSTSKPAHGSSIVSMAGGAAIALIDSDSELIDSIGQPGRFRSFPSSSVECVNAAK